MELWQMRQILSWIPKDNETRWQSIKRELWMMADCLFLLALILLMFVINWWFR